MTVKERLQSMEKSTSSDLYKERKGESKTARPIGSGVRPNHVSGSGGA